MCCGIQLSVCVDFISAAKLIQSLLLRSWHTSLKNVSSCYCRRLSYNYTCRSSLNYWTHTSFHQHLSKKLSDSIKLNTGSVRLFLTHQNAPTQKVTRLANKDRIPDTYELIYSIPARMGVRLGYFSIIFLSGLIVYMICYLYFEERDEPLEVKYGAFDNEGLYAIQIDDVPYLLGGLVVAVYLFWALISRIPFRIYRSASERNRHYIAVFLNRLRPWDTHNHQFLTGKKLKFNFFTRYIFYMETYQLGSRRAALFPTSFRSAYDHDEMIDFQLGKSYFDVREDSKESDEKLKVVQTQKKSK